MVGRKNQKKKMHRGREASWILTLAIVALGAVVIYLIRRLVQVERHIRRLNREAAHRIEPHEVQEAVRHYLEEHPQCIAQACGPWIERMFSVPAASALLSQHPMATASHSMPPPPGLPVAAPGLWPAAAAIGTRADPGVDACATRTRLHAHPRPCPQPRARAPGQTTQTPCWEMPNSADANGLPPWLQAEQPLTSPEPAAAVAEWPAAMPSPPPPAASHKPCPSDVSAATRSCRGYTERRAAPAALADSPPCDNDKPTSASSSAGGALGKHGRESECDQRQPHEHGHSRDRDCNTDGSNGGSSGDGGSGGDGGDGNGNGNGTCDGDDDHSGTDIDAGRVDKGDAGPDSCSDIAGAAAETAACHNDRDEKAGEQPSSAVATRASPSSSGVTRGDNDGPQQKTATLGSEARASPAGIAAPRPSLSPSSPPSPPLLLLRDCDAPFLIGAEDFRTSSRLLIANEDDTRPYNLCLKGVEVSDGRPSVGWAAPDLSCAAHGWVFVFEDSIKEEGASKSDDASEP